MAYNGLPSNFACDSDITTDCYDTGGDLVRSGLLKLRTAVHNPDREDVSGGPWQSPNLVQNPF